MKRKENLEGIALDSEVFQRLNQSLESGVSEIRTELFAKLVDILVSKKIITKSGNIVKNRESSLEYLEAILPFMTLYELEVLDTEPEDFIKKFLFSPSENKNSLATYLESIGILDENFHLNSQLGRRGDSSEIFDEFREQYEMSPFEKIDKYIAINFWGMTKESTDLPSEIFED